MSKVIQFLQEVRAEFKNITWPKRDTLLELTIVVISISILISLVLGGFDYIFTNSLAYLGNLKNTAPGKTSLPQTIQITGSPVSTASPTIKLTPTIINKNKK